MTEADVRVLGALIEKEMTTPDYYPLSLNALTAACNQASNRDPVVSYDEDTVSQALDRLRRMSLARSIKRADSRVSKFSHNADETLSLSASEKAILCTLLLRGPQTVGELKVRASRMAPFASTLEVEQVLVTLGRREGAPLVAHLPRRPGQKDGRYAHLLAGEVAAGGAVDPEDSVEQQAAAGDGHLATLKERVEELEKSLADLRSEFAAFRRQFE